MTVSQAIGLCPTLRLIEPDPVHYDDCFARLLAALNEISPVIESGELGLAYVGTDGLEGIFGSHWKIIEAIRLTVGRSDWDSDKESLWLGSLRRDQNRTRLSSSPWEQKKHFSLYSPSPSFPSTRVYIAVCDCSAFARSAHSPRFRKKRSPRSSAKWEDDCGDLPPAASWSPSQDASPPSRSSPRSRSSHRSASASCSGIHSSS